MENNKANEKEEKSSNTAKAQQKTPKKLLLFSEKEFIGTVRSFIDAWLRGQITINFPTAAELEKQKQGTNLSFRYPGGYITPQSQVDEIKGKELFMSLVATACSDEATIVEQETAISQLFQMLMAYRCGKRIIGSFTIQNDLEPKISRMEDQITAMNKLLEELIVAFRSHDHRAT